MLCRVTPGRVCQHRRAGGTGKAGCCGLQTLRFRAVVTLDASAAEVPAGHYPSGAHLVIVHAHQPGRPGSYRDFPAVLCRDDEVPLRPGERAVVTLTLAGDEAGRFLSAGCHFTLWAGGEVGHGVVSRRVYCLSGPC